MAAIRRNPLAAGVVILLVGCVVVFGVFLTLLRSIGSDPSPGLLSAQGMAHRLLVGRESIAHRRAARRRVPSSASSIQGATATWPARELATHIGVAVCLRGDRADRRGALLLPALQAGVPATARCALTPAETSIAADRKAYGGEFVEGRRPAGRADPEEDRLALAGAGTYFLVRTPASIQSWRLTWP